MSDSESDYTTLGTLKTARAASVPDVLDVLVAGGGPAGIAAAMKAAELGLSALIVDYDDLMKRIRDYPKDKDIYPSFGGGDKLAFPPGGPLVTGLQFDPIDKDVMVAEWKHKAREASLLVKIGSELVGLTPLDDGLYEARVWNHRGNLEVRYRSRNLVIAIGAGSPRRFDIPGNIDGLAFRLSDADKYVGAPALVIGGGTSAAEAVIYISNAKAKKEDACKVYWSYRADKMPKVSQELSGMFFDAYVGNGNIHYLPFSEPTAVVTGPDKRDYLSLRVDRKVIEGRPIETVHLEFPKEHVVACIGEDPPFRFLQGLGCKVPTIGERPIMLLNREGETSLPGVFLVGDARGPRYLRCTDFEDSGTFEQVTQKRNIKQGLWDAVQAVEVIGARMGREVVALHVAPVAEPRPAAKPAVVPPAPSQPADARRPEVEFQLVSLLPDGTRENEFGFSGERMTIGRKDTDVACPEDVYMADLHAVVGRREGRYEIEDKGGSGVWLRLQANAARALEEGDAVWLGAQLLVLAKAKSGWVLEHYDGDGVLQSRHAVGAEGVVVGKKSSVPLDINDGSLSRRHAAFRLEGGRIMASDLGSTNGTYVKLTKPTALRDGDELRLGGKRFRAEIYAPVAKLAASEIVVDKPIEPSATPSEAPAAVISEGLIPVVIDHPQHPASFGVAPGQAVLLAFFDYLKIRYPDCKLNKKGIPNEHNEEPLDWQCLNATCGLCAVQIVSGAENFLPPDPGTPEMKTLEFPRGLEGDPKRYRLTCVARLQGPVRLTVPE